MRTKRILFLLAILVAGIMNAESQSHPGKIKNPAQNKRNDAETLYFIHKVERGETVYSISKQYGLSVNEIYKLNPSSKSALPSGSILRIPQISGSYIFHNIKPKETMYSLAKKYGMRGEDIIAANPGLSVATFKTGKTIRIPTNKVTYPMKGDPAADKARANALLTMPARIVKTKTIRIALLLPFGTNKPASEKLPQNKYSEFYEGVLLSAKESKAAGINVVIDAFNTGETDNALRDILKRETMKEANAIIGGVNESQISLLSAFSREHSIPYIIPTVRSDVSLSNPFVFLINTPHSYLYSKASGAFCSKFRFANIVLVNTGKPEGEKEDFARQLISDLKRRRLNYKEIRSGGRDFTGELKSKLVSNKENLIIPSDDSEKTLNDMTACLEYEKKHSPGIDLSLFGYPVWQVYATDRSRTFHKLNVSYYSFFYSNRNLPRLKVFSSLYTRTYHKNLLDIYPKYGVLGYDIASYFIKAIHLYGKYFYKSGKLNTIPFKGIQTDFRFERENNWSGFINTNMYIITYNLNNTIIKKRY